MNNIYKYASVQTAIKIIKSGKVLLNSPDNFNDPFDTRFSKENTELEKCFELIKSYNIVSFLDKFLQDKKIKGQSINNLVISKFLSALNIAKTLCKKAKYPQFTQISGTSFVCDYLSKQDENFKNELESTNRKFKKQISKGFAEFRKMFLISCFSKRNDSILMWSHYGDSHHGICIEFEPQSDSLFDVKYSKVRKNIDIYNIISLYLGKLFIGEALKDLPKKEIDNLIDICATKAKDWSYEEEVRYICTKNNKPNEVDYDFENYFAIIGKIKAIYIGCKASGEDLDRLIRLAKNRDIKCVFMKESKSKYLIVEDKNHKYMPTNKKEETYNPLFKHIEEIEKCLNSKCYLAAFLFSLNIPAICGSKEFPYLDNKSSYIKWADKHFSYSEKGGASDDFGMPYTSGELLYDIREQFMNHGNFKVSKDYKEFKLTKFILRIEDKKPMNMYTEEACSDGELVINVRNIAFKLTAIATNIYKNKKNVFGEDDLIDMENRDITMEEFEEIKLLNLRFRMKK